MKKLLLLITLLTISISYSQTNKKGEFFNLTNISLSIPTKVYSSPRVEFGGFERNLSKEIKDEYTIGIDYTKGFYVTDTFSVGLGVGYTHFKYNWIDDTTSEVDHYDLFNFFVDVRKYFSHSNESPFVFVDYGRIVKTWFDFKYEYEYNNSLKFGFGYNFNPHKKLNLLTSIFYSKNRFTQHRIRDVNGVGLNLGVIF